MSRAPVECFEDLLVWQKGIELVKEVYRVTGDGRLSRDFGLRDQIQRAAVPIPTNIAEGFERGSRKEYVRFLYIAKGSAGEVRSLLRVARELEYLEAAQHEQLQSQVLTVSRFLANQIKSLEAKDR